MPTLSKSTLVTIVTFNPEIGLFRKNLAALCEQFEHILIVDNGSTNIAEIDEIAKVTGKKIEIERLPENMGIAFAQNIGFSRAKKMKVPWLLTMDQDSVIPANLTDEYQNILEAYDNVGLVSWDQREGQDNVKIIENDWWILSSGCLTSIAALNKVGGFDNELFIDHVDTDVNIKIRNAGFKTITTGKVKLNHHLGVETAHKTIRGANYREHSPVRVYYIIRNGIVIFKRYFFKQPIWMLQALKTCFREGIYLLYFQPHKMKNIPLLAKAWWDGVFNNLGRYN